jgi:hypothetical protein
MHVESLERHMLPKERDKDWKAIFPALQKWTDEVTKGSSAWLLQACQRQ